jgi:hypothetical protein
MAEPNAPLILELAPLPRDQVGPFLLLGLPKDASKEQVEAHWAERVKAARKGQLTVPLEDVNWARESINDPDRRVMAVAATLNADTDEGFLRKLAERYHVGAPAWTPVDVEKSLADYSPPADLPDAAEVRRGVTLPEVPPDLPAVARLLEQFLPESVDPWAVPLAPDPSEDPDS